MGKIGIVLLEPEIPQNTGNIARTCAATGASLHLIKPLGFEITDAKLKRAGLDYWHFLDVNYYENFEDFLQKTDGGEYFFFSTKAPRAYTEIRYPENCFLIFGKETAGIPEEILKKYLDRCVRIPMRENLRSLNLSNSAAIAVYEVLRQRNFENLEEKGFLSVLYGN
ncbi:MAG: tRNA (uridine(34)/cytosine(34)/5-carboxymethylaminomethyluridine(34)-2'-O)-methyltransferase TrmL [Clostridia bacterium]|nr:tRNA (uridine(34)/cytosine(34)/5-carboxymethylaminomethyluridine(34)-2'-O)-methyltransferase TrmL [Clostridia bacterium]MBR4979553.1 tRNA (uridine(34)/cytosine(34)/5-carboxymethylaminomethyluridine(34)-2'-O)-methyltransferase TrmL [Clostridia bacterium]